MPPAFLSYRGGDLVCLPWGCGIDFDAWGWFGVYLKLSCRPGLDDEVGGLA